MGSNTNSNYKVNSKLVRKFISAEKLRRLQRRLQHLQQIYQALEQRAQNIDQNVG